MSKSLTDVVVEQDRAVQFAGTAAIVLLTVYMLGAAVSQFISPYNPLRASLSTYANGPYGYIVETGFILSFLTYPLMIFALGRTLARSTQRILGQIGFAITALAVLLVIFFPSSTFVDRPTDGIHITSAFIAFAVFPIATILFTIAFGRDPRWQAFQRTAWGFVIANLIVVAVFASLYISHTTGEWIAEKVDVVITNGWVIATALWLRRLAS